MIGSRLGPYELVEKIGVGGMAMVYRAYQPRMDRYVAIKVIRHSNVKNSLAIDRFQREAKLVARLEHPHLLPIYDFDGGHDPPYIVMRYLEGSTLKYVLKQGLLPHPEVLYLLRQVSQCIGLCP